MEEWIYCWSTSVFFHHFHFLQGPYHKAPQQVLFYVRILCLLLWTKLCIIAFVFVKNTSIYTDSFYNAHMFLLYYIIHIRPYKRIEYRIAASLPIPLILPCTYSTFSFANSSLKTTQSWYFGTIIPICLQSYLLCENVPWCTIEP